MAEKHGGSSARVLTNVDQRLKDKLPEEEFLRVADARRSVWTGGFIGTLAGASAGLAGIILYKRLVAPKWLQSKHIALSCLASAAAGSYIGATYRGRSAVAGLSDVFEHASTPKGSYRDKVTTAVAEAAAASGNSAPHGGLRTSSTGAEREGKQVVEEDGGIKYEEPGRIAMK